MLVIVLLQGHPELTNNRHLLEGAPELMRYEKAESENAYDHQNNATAARGQYIKERVCSPHRWRVSHLFPPFMGPHHGPLLPVHRVERPLTNGFQTAHSQCPPAPQASQTALH